MCPHIQQSSQSRPDPGMVFVFTFTEDHQIRVQVIGQTWTFFVGNSKVEVLEEREKPSRPNFPGSGSVFQGSLQILKLVSRFSDPFRDFQRSLMRAVVSVSRESLFRSSSSWS